jgi:hypothetical protein
LVASIIAALAIALWPTSAADTAREDGARLGQAVGELYNAQNQDEVARALGVAVLGSILTSAYASGLDDAVGGLSATAASQATDSVGAAHQVAAGIGSTAGADLISAANQAFVDAMATTASIAAAIAMIGALIAAAFLPARAQRNAASHSPEPVAANA